MTDRTRRTAATTTANHAPCPRRKIFHVRATERAISAGLADMRSFLEASGLDADACGTAEIVLAEALNNIAEHAFAMTTAGTISVTLAPGQRTLTAQIVDTGAALPGLGPPAGQLPPFGATTSSLPEGGFGWFLIQTLTECLRYKRHDEQNHLCLRFAFSSSAPEKV
ncbi:ATP-binding protein [Roseovarius sp. M141]|uniref:ATP-binding protein n=1 Tax=Roseovarius sp. M141 TaxID=2583806 RepID=UPI0020CDF345|nr:ATP-binding protein [Roseovarius sp. M141]MCQ0091927.1 ATP-binding protein [Roseovarius sp. M141]